MTSIPNPLGLSPDELDAIRSLQTGVHRIAADDPVWEGLADVGLVDPDSLAAGAPQLTVRGLGYRTGTSP